MVCVHCSSETQVINSRLQKRSNSVWRRRRCVQCKAIFTTTESAEYSALWRVRSQKGTLTPFSRDKLFISLYACLGHRDDALNDATGLTATVITKLLPAAGPLDTKTIIQTASVALNRFDALAAQLYLRQHGHR